MIWVGQCFVECFARNLTLRRGNKPDVTDEVEIAAAFAAQLVC
jgi:hypothetical protein